MEIMKFVADTERSGVRVDRYLADVCPDFSRSYLQKLLKEQMVSVNGKAVRANYKTQTGDEIMLQVPDMQTPDIQPEDIALDILYEDEDILVLNKPAGGTSKCRTYGGHSGKCGYGTLRGAPFRDQWRFKTRNRA